MHKLFEIIKYKDLLTYLWHTLLVVVSLVFFFFAISLISSSFKDLGKDTVESMLIATSNPFIGLFIGLLITAIIQSSSTSTSMIVAIVATGSLTLESAVPMIIGANIGTTLTSSLVALSFVASKKAFRRAISAGVIHDFFNILLTIVLLPLELFYGILSTTAVNIGHQLVQIEPVLFNKIYLPLFGELTELSEKLATLIPHNLLAVFISFIILLASVRFLSWVIYRRLIGKSKKNFRNFLFKNDFQSFSLGLLLTSAIQSSSVTTSLIVPLVASRKVALKRCYPYIVGSNLGTTFTALIAALFINETAISVAIIHLLFNLAGLMLLLAIPLARNFPIILAKSFSRKVEKYRYLGFAYVIFIFFLAPFSLIYFNKGAITKSYFNKTENIQLETHNQDNFYEKCITEKKSR